MDTQDDIYISNLIDTYQFRGELEKRWEEVFQLFDVTYIRRLKKWLLFFDTTINKVKQKHYLIDTSSLYRKSALALFSLALDEQWFSQTTHEFELSKKFYEKVLNSGKLLTFQTDKQALFFLKTSIAFSYYPGLVKTSSAYSSEFLYPCPTLDALSLFFKSIFSKYDNTCSLALYHYIPEMTRYDLDLFMNILQGKSLRKTFKYGKEYTRKQSYYLLYYLPKDLNITEGVFKTCWYYTSLMAISNDEYIFSEFYSRLRMSTKNLNLFFKDFTFWLKAYSFISRNKGELRSYYESGFGLVCIGDLVDYLMHQRYTIENHISFKQRSMFTLCQSVQFWETNIELYYYKPIDKISWGNKNNDEWTYQSGDEIYCINEIKDSDALYYETNTLKHCVFIYMQDCLANKKQLYSLKKYSKTKYKNTLTIELHKDQVFQIRGKYNRLPKQKELDVIKVWTNANGYFMPTLEVK